MCFGKLKVLKKSSFFLLSSSPNFHFFASFSNFASCVILWAAITALFPASIKEALIPFFCDYPSNSGIHFQKAQGCQALELPFLGQVLRLNLTVNKTNRCFRLLMKKTYSSQDILCRRLGWFLPCWKQDRFIWQCLRNVVSAIFCEARCFKK